MAAPKVILGVSGGVAAYKAVDLASKLTQSGHDVHVVMTTSATKFVTPITFRAITKNPVLDSLWSDPTTPVPHISLADEAALVILAPATANLIGKLANGIADDMLTTTVMACKSPKIVVPSMNCNMWDNPIVQQNIAKLKGLGYIFVEPDYGYLACGVVGKGRYPDNGLILAEAASCLAYSRALVGKKIIITGGGTSEQIDPVRVISNRSSGKMGRALAGVAQAMGAQVVYVEADSVAQLKQAIATDFETADALIMAAAVSDYVPVKISKSKLKSDQDKLVIELKKGEDLLAYFGGIKKQQYLIGFALESDNLLENAQKKLNKKNLDLIVGNGVEAIGADSSTVILVDKQGVVKQLGQLSKPDLARIVLERLCSDICK